MTLTPVVCGDCDDFVVPNASGWYRCRSCGYESLRDIPDGGSQHLASSSVGVLHPNAGPLSSCAVDPSPVFTRLPDVELYCRDEAAYAFSQGCAAAGGAGLVSLFDKS